MNAYSDKELAGLMKSDDKRVSDEAFKVIFNRHSSKLHAYCYRILNNRTQAEDIFQETFIKFYKNVQSNYKTGSIIGFLITIARNLCLNYKRDKKPTVAFEEFHSLKSDHNTYEKEETHKLMTMAIDLLDLEYKEPLVMRLYDGLSYNEIAEVLDITPENARKRVFRAKQKIKTILKPYMEELYG